MAADTRPIDPLGRPDIVYDKGHGLGTLTRRFKVKGKYTTAAQLPTNIKRAFEAPDFEHTDFLLAAQTIDGTEAQDGETSILVETYIQVPSDAATEVQIGGNVVTYLENNLKVVEQRKFVKRTHTLAGTVGTTTGETDIGEPDYDADIAGLILSQNQFAERGKVSAVVVKRWAEAGVLDRSRQDVGEGRFEETVVFLGVEDAAELTGPVVDRDTRNWNGFRTIVVKTVQNKSGATITGGTAFSSKVQWEFDYPGEVKVVSDTGTVTVGGTGDITAIAWTDYKFSLVGPSNNVPITATKTVSYQTNANLSLTHPRWISPSAKGKITGLALTSLSKITTADVDDIVPGGREVTFNGYTAVSPKSQSGSGTISISGTTLTLSSVEGEYRIGPWTITVSGGPGRPDGGTYTLFADAELDFTDVDGVQYYKHTIIHATIPPNTHRAT